MEYSYDPWGNLEYHFVNEKLENDEETAMLFGLSMLDLIINDESVGTKVLDLMDADFVQNFAVKEIDNSKYRIKYPIEKAPQYLKAFIKNNFELQRADWFEGEFRHDLKNISGIAVIDARKN